MGSSASSVEAKAGTEGETMEEPWLLVCPRLMLNRLSYTGQPHLPKHGTAYSRLGHPVSISHQENVPINMPTCQSNEGNSLVEGSSPQVCQVNNLKYLLTSSYLEPLEPYRLYELGSL